jgi:hypothetical protein
MSFPSVLPDLPMVADINWSGIGLGGVVGGNSGGGAGVDAVGGCVQVVNPVDDP